MEQSDMGLHCFSTMASKIYQLHDEYLRRLNYDNESVKLGAQWLSVRVLDLRPRGRGFESHRRHCVVSLSKTHFPCSVLVQPRRLVPT